MPEKTCRNTLEFRNVTFAYPGANEPVIKGISFVSGPGETTAIIGRTGCGKSSIVKLIPRLYDTLFGDVLVDGVNIKDYQLEELRNQIGYVPQKNVLFSGDIASNMNFGNENGTEEDWKEALRIACAEEFVEKKDGVYHAEVSQGGTNFSGGQQQLLTIARAIIANPEIMILDEATSNVDAHTEQTIQNAMTTLLGGRTSFVIAHRLSTIRDAHAILYMENGDIKEVGNHETLMAMNGKYAALYNSQFA